MADDEVSGRRLRDVMADLDPDEVAAHMEDARVETAESDSDGVQRMLMPHQVDLTMSEIRSVELRKAGASFQEIADALGWDHRSSALRAVRRALQKWGIERLDELRQLEMARLDTITQKLWPSILGERDDDGGWVREPDKDAMRLYLQVSQRRSALLGLDAPHQLEIGPAAEGDGEVQSVQDLDVVRGLLEEMGNDQPPADSGGDGEDMVEAEVIRDDDDG